MKKLSGLQFNIDELLVFHSQRALTSEELTSKTKRFVNPNTLKPFQPRDMALIAEICDHNQLEEIFSAEDAYVTGKFIVKHTPSLFSLGEKLLIKAANSEHADAAYLLFKIYFSVTEKYDWFEYQNYPLGLDYLKVAVDNSHQNARNFYAKLLFEGAEELGVKPNPKKSLLLLDNLVAENFLPAILTKIKFYENELNMEDILSLLEKASMLGDADSSYALAYLYFRGKAENYPGLFVTADLVQSIKYLHLSFEQGNVGVANILADLYFGEKINWKFPEVFDQMALQGLQNIDKGVAVLLQAVNTKNDPAIRSSCALRLANHFLTAKAADLTSEQRKENVLHFYQLAMDLEDSDALAPLGELYLYGNANLDIATDVSAADRVFARAKESSVASRIAQTIAISADNSPIFVSHYLYWTLRQLDLIKGIEDPSFNKSLGDIEYLFNTGHARLEDKKSSKNLLVTPNANLAKRWSDLREKYIGSRLPGLPEREQSILSYRLYPQLLEDTYHYLNLKSPFEFEMRQSISNRRGTFFCCKRGSFTEGYYVTVSPDICNTGKPSAELEVNFSYS